MRKWEALCSLDSQSPFCSPTTTSVVGYTQNQDNDVVIGALHDVHDGYSIKSCASDGRTLLMGSFALEQNSGQSSWNPQHSHWSMSGVSRDGSTITYQLPEGLKPQSAAYDGSDLVVLPSGKAIVEGTYRPAGEDEVKRVAAVVDTDGKMLKRIRRRFRMLFEKRSQHADHEDEC